MRRRRSISLAWLPGNKQRFGRHISKGQKTMNPAKALVASALLLWTGSGTAQAFETCFQLNDYSDIFRLSSDSLDSAIVGTVEAITTNNGFPVSGYRIPLVGFSAILPPPNQNPTVRGTGMHGVNGTAFFGNHSDCTFQIVTGSVAQPGVTVNCAGRVPGFFNGSASGHYINCDQTAAAHAKVAHTASAARAKAFGE
jgi:hypothetical protein